MPPKKDSPTDITTTIPKEGFILPKKQATSVEPADSQPSAKPKFERKNAMLDLLTQQGSVSDSTSASADIKQKQDKATGVTSKIESLNKEIIEIGNKIKGSVISLFRLSIGEVVEYLKTTLEAKKTERQELLISSSNANAQVIQGSIEAARNLSMGGLSNKDKLVAFQNLRDTVNENANLANVQVKKLTAEINDEKAKSAQLAKQIDLIEAQLSSKNEAAKSTDETQKLREQQSKLQQTKQQVDKNIIQLADTQRAAYNASIMTIQDNRTPKELADTINALRAKATNPKDKAAQKSAQEALKSAQTDAKQKMAELKSQNAENAKERAQVEKDIKSRMVFTQQVAKDFQEMHKKLQSDQQGQDVPNSAKAQPAQAIPTQKEVEAYAQKLYDETSKKPASSLDEMLAKEDAKNRISENLRNYQDQLENLKKDQETLAKLKKPQQEIQVLQDAMNPKAAKARVDKKAADAKKKAAADKG